MNCGSIFLSGVLDKDKTTAFLFEWNAPYLNAVFTNTLIAMFRDGSSRELPKWPRVQRYR
jgi:hypothetical protein